MVAKGKANSIETLNLLISIRTNIEDYPISDNKLLDLFNLKVSKENNKIEFIKKHNHLGYFQIMVLIAFIRNSKPELTNFIESYILQLLSSSTDICIDTELTCLAFDSLSCPYFSNSFKVKLFNELCREVKFENSDEEILNFIKGREWFFTWQDNNLAQVLMKKELRSPY